MAPILLCYLQCWHLDFNKGYEFNQSLSVLNPCHCKSLHWITSIPFHIIIYVFFVHNQCNYNTKSFQTAMQALHASLPMWSFITRFMLDLGPWLKNFNLGWGKFNLFYSIVILTFSKSCKTLALQKVGCYKILLLFWWINPGSETPHESFKRIHPYHLFVVFIQSPRAFQSLQSHWSIFGLKFLKTCRFVII